MSARLTVSNRPENLRILQDFVRRWGKDHGLPPNRRDNLEEAATEIFQHLVTGVYGPQQPVSIVVRLENQGTRLRLTFEDDGPAPRPEGLNPFSGGICLSPALLWIRKTVW